MRLTPQKHVIVHLYLFGISVIPASSLLSHEFFIAKDSESLIAGTSNGEFCASQNVPKPLSTK